MLNIYFFYQFADQGPTTSILLKIRVFFFLVSYFIIIDNETKRMDQLTYYYKIPLKKKKKIIRISCCTCTCTKMLLLTT